ncbi:MAG: hypothetical protein ACTHKG_01920 [Nocardioides sp.]
MRIHHLRTAARHLAGVHVRAHQVALRNAMVASTALTQRRIELDEVEAFLAQHRRRYDARRAAAG